MATEAATFGANLRRLRKGLGMTQREVAEQLPGKTEGKDISRYEKGQHIPGPDTRSALAKILGVSVAAFYETEDEVKPTPDPFAYKAVDVERAVKMEAMLQALLDHFEIEWMTPEAATKPKPKKGPKK